MKFFTIFLLYFVSLCVAIIKGQFPWYLNVSCHDTSNGVICYDSNNRVVVVPFGNRQNGYPQPLPNAVYHQYQQTDPSTATSVARSRDPSELSCSDTEFRCTSLHQCIESGNYCDGYVNCVDGTDEKDCSCVSKLDRNKRCDNYVDCPNGEDEVGCNGCSDHSYSCNSGVLGECFTKEQMCDVFTHCSNGADEMDCVLLTDFSNEPVNPNIRSIEGTLLRNYKGIWYPVCTDYLNLYAQQVCDQELGANLSHPTITYLPYDYSGIFFSKINHDTINLVNDCLKTASSNQFIHVKCSDECGVNTASTKLARIAIGKDASAQSHPWIAGIYLNGTFVCAGSIVQRKVIITAAHCLHHKGVRLTNYDYLQVRVGFIRHSSFSPYEQFVTVDRAVIHPTYSRRRYHNDIAVLQLSNPLFFNRWVKAICLQANEFIGDGDNPKWLWKPDPNTICSTAGWGDFTDRGPFPVENLAELELPILSNCVEDNVNVTCAGYPNGGADTCTGDSGGPLECRTGRNPNKFYLGGILSTGYNPKKKKHDKIFCGEPDSVTTFTKPSLYLDWITKSISEKDVNDILPTQICPGVICRTNNRCAKKYDGIVDCMNGEDEVKNF